MCSLLTPILVDIFMIDLERELMKKTKKERLIIGLLQEICT